MAKAKVVLTDYVWESLDVEREILGGLADLVPMQTKKPEEYKRLANTDPLTQIWNRRAFDREIRVRLGRFGVQQDRPDRIGEDQEGGAQPGIRRGIGQAAFDGHGDFTDQFRKLARALRILRALAKHYVLKLGMTCHFRT